MQSSIEFVFVLSRAPSEYEKEKLEKFVKTLLPKIIKEKNSLKNLEVHYDRIFLEYCTEKIPAHRALPKIVKEFENFLHEFRIGLRDCYAKRYELGLNVKGEGIKDIEIPFVKSCKAIDSKVTIVLELLDYSFFSKGNMDRLLKLVKEKIKGKSKEIAEVIEVREEEKDLRNGKEILNLYSLENLLSPEISGLYFEIKREIEENLEEKGFSKVVIFPYRSGKELIQKLGKLNINPEDLNFLYVLNHKKNKEMERIKDKFKILLELDEEEMKENIKLIGVMNLGYLELCIPFSGKFISKESIPLKIYSDPEKRIAGVVMGYPSDADNFMEELTNFLKDVFKKFGLGYRVKKMGNRIELESKSKRNKRISIAKVMPNKNLGNLLNIKSNNGYLSCTGFEIDLENLLIAYLAHHPSIKNEKKIKIL